MEEMNYWVLVIEDEKELRELLTEHLTQAGFRVLSSGKAADATRILRNQKFACVLMDMCLEGGTGSQIVASVRDDKKNVNHLTPFLVLSGQLSVEIVMKVKNQVNGILVKPCDITTLVAKVKAVCSLVPSKAS